MRNAGASIAYGWLSQACVECTGNEGSETFSTTFKCHRDCYFCFNHNQAEYQRFFDEGCPWREGLEASRQRNDSLACVALTGGEPLLDVDESISFLKRARELFPSAHMRMYTSGDLLTREAAFALRDVGLREIRFSVKLEDDGSVRERVLENMALAKEAIPDVMVEMPIIPGADDVMRGLMRRLAQIGVKGMNLLEFCFPFNNWPEFEKRGFLLKNPPFPIMYDYGYSGGLAVAGSEELALSLMLWGIDEGLGFGMHYCSLENKHRSEMRQRNEKARGLSPCFSFDEGDFFIKAGKVFGGERELVVAALRERGCESFLPDDEEESVAFPLAYIDALAGLPVTPATSVCAIESEGGDFYLREIALVVRPHEAAR